MTRTIPFRYYIPDTPAEACVVIVHGMQEHQNRYISFAQFLRERGIVVMTYDLPGHGPLAQSEKTLGYFGSEDGWNVLVDSAHQCIAKVRREYPQLPVWYFGHSMGTIIGRCYLQKWDSEIDGMLLSGMPCYNPAAKTGLLLAKGLRGIKGEKGHSRLLDELMTGQFNRKIDHPETSVDWLSVDRENRQSFLEDTLCGNPFTIQGYIDLIEGMLQMQDASLYEKKNLNLPICCYAGSEDPCIGGKKGFLDSIEFLKKVGYRNIRYKMYEGKRHEILHEDIQEELMENVVDFIMESNKQRRAV